MRKYRIFSQVIFLLLFIFLFLKTTYDKNNLIAYPVKAFLDLDPFIFLSTLFSLHGVLLLLPPAILLSFLTILVTILLGRIFCGWVCPLGTLNQWTGSLKNNSRLENRNSKLFFSYRFKYYLLIFLLTASIFTLQLSGIFDPLSLLIRSFSVAVFPAFHYVINSVFDAFYALDLTWLNSALDRIFSVLRDSVLFLSQPTYVQSFFIALIFLAVLILNLYQRRFFCRYLCPLGACLGIFSSLSPVRIDIQDTCNRCGSCLHDCQGGLNVEREMGWRKSECLLCGSCIASCPERAIKIRFSKKYLHNIQLPDMRKRAVLISVVSGIVAVPLLRISPGGKVPNPELIRPPGALEEEEFRKRCIKCGECLKVCLTNGLQPTLFEAGLEGIWSPRLVSQIGYCAYNCTLCGQVCPTGAIRKLSAGEKAKIKIGLAFIDQGRCLPYAFGRSCIVCEEHCPTPQKAIWFNEKEIVNRVGERNKVKQPMVDPELCIGCGICEFKCPVKDKPAIRVTSAGETRSKMNQPLLTFL
jgi:polyferredoxin/formate hydrogenlyase subunit 6/NADH:ubiquinone oxidoreductase subunit I